MSVTQKSVLVFEDGCWEIYWNLLYELGFDSLCAQIVLSITEDGQLTVIAYGEETTVNLSDYCCALVDGDLLEGKVLRGLQGPDLIQLLAGRLSCIINASMPDRRKRMEAIGEQVAPGKVISPGRKIRNIEILQQCLRDAGVLPAHA